MVWTDICRTKAGVVKIDTRETFDAGWETMVFYCKEDGIVNYSKPPIDCMRYRSEEEAEEGHKQMVEKWV